MVCITTWTGNALDLLSHWKFDLILLDHDLDGQALTSSDENSGAHIARNLKSTLNKDTFCIVHSMNPFGSKRIIDILGNQAIWYPFHKLVTTIGIKDE